VGSQNAAIYMVGLLWAFRSREQINMNAECERQHMQKRKTEKLTKREKGRKKEKTRRVKSEEKSEKTYMKARDSSVDRMTMLRVGRHGFDSWQGRIFPFAKMSTPAQNIVQSLVQQIPVSAAGHKTNHSPNT
jgi:hypothetical protein